MGRSNLPAGDVEQLASRPAPATTELATHAADPAAATRRGRPPHRLSTSDVTCHAAPPRVNQDAARAPRLCDARNDANFLECDLVDPLQHEPPAHDIEPTRTVTVAVSRSDPTSAIKVDTPDSR